MRRSSFSATATWERARASWPTSGCGADRRRTGDARDEPGEEATEHRPVAQDERCIPERLTHGQEPEALKAADAGAEEPRGEHAAFCALESAVLDLEQGDNAEVARLNGLSSFDIGFPVTR